MISEWFVKKFDNTQSYVPYFEAEHIVLIKKEIYICDQGKLMEVQYNCSVHVSAYLFTISVTVSSYSHKEPK